MTLLSEVRYLGMRPGARGLALPQELRVIQAEYMHEVAILTYVHDNTIQRQITHGLPVQIRYGRGVSFEPFHGVVHHVVVDQEMGAGGKPRLVRVVCVGATDPLNRPAARKYTDIRVDAVVSELAREAGLSVLVEQHDYRWPLLQQTNQSTWAFLVACAKRVGYTLYARNTDLRCHSRVIRYPGALTFRDVAGVDDERVNAVHSFEIVQAETLNAATTKRRRIVQGLDSQSSSFVSTAGTPRNVSGLRSIAARLDAYEFTSAASIGEADALVLGEQELNRHYVHAKATLSGFASLHPARAVRLTGINSDHDGYWFPTRVEHVITQSHYRTMVEIGKDSFGDVAGAGASTTFPGDTKNRAVAYDGISTQAAATSAPLGTDSRWVDVVQQWRSTAAVQRRLAPSRRLSAVTLEGSSRA